MNLLISIPVCTLSPICNSHIVTDFPFSILTFAMDGKQLDDSVIYCHNLSWKHLNINIKQKYRNKEMKMFGKSVYFFLLWNAI